MQDYKSLLIAVMICDSLVNTQTDTHTRRQLLTGYTVSSASSAKNHHLTLSGQIGQWALHASKTEMLLYLAGATPELGLQYQGTLLHLWVLDPAVTHILH